MSIDKLLHISGSSASEIMLAQAISANNLSNISTPGFKATMLAQKSIPVYGDGLPSRVFVGTEAAGYDLSPGSINYTGNQLDVAIAKDGWFAVQGNDGTEGYTKRGDLRVEHGMLVNGAGDVVLGGGGAISVPPAQSINIEADGTINVVPLGQSNATVGIGKLKLVNPDPKSLTKREDGLFVSKKAGELAEVDLNVRLKTGMAEASNVNAVSEMVDMITFSRQYELSTKMMSNAEENSQALAQLLRIG